MAVGVGKKIDRSELLEIAMGIKKNAFRVDDFDQLIANMDELLDEACKLEREQVASFAADRIPKMPAGKSMDFVWYSLPVL